MKGLVKWMETQIKAKGTEVKAAEENVSAFGSFEDCGEYYHTELAIQRAQFKQMVEWKIATEKYMKRLRHQEAEISNTVPPTKG